MLMIVLSILSVTRQSDLWQQQELASELESDLRDTVNWSKSGLLILMLGKLSWIRLTGLITMVLLI